MHAFAFLALRRPNARRTGTAWPEMASRQAGLLRAVFLVFLPFAAGYFLSYFFRSTNAVIAPQLISEVGLNAGDLGLLTAMYFLTFAACQLPLGVLLDRYGPRRVQAGLLLFAVAGALVFSAGDRIEILAMGRALIGFGVAGCLMATVKAGTEWFEARHWPIVNGCALAVGGLGAMSATTPLEATLGVMDWRGVFLLLAAATLAVSLIIFVTVPEPGAARTAQPLVRAFRDIGRIYGDAGFWRLAPLTVTSMAANLAIQGLWAGPWLQDVADLGRDAVAHYLLILALALTGGSVVLGVLASWLERFGVPLLVFVGACTLVFMGFQAAIVFELMPRALWPWIGYGMFANIAMVTFAYIARYFPPELSGRATTAMNMLIFLGVFLTQTAIGEVIDLWPAASGSGYDPDGYATAFGLVLLSQVVSFLWFLIPLGRCDTQT